MLNQFVDLMLGAGHCMPSYVPNHDDPDQAKWNWGYFNYLSNIWWWDYITKAICKLNAILLSPSSPYCNCTCTHIKPEWPPLTFLISHQIFTTSRAPPHNTELGYIMCRIIAFRQVVLSHNNGRRPIGSYLHEQHSSLDDQNKCKSQRSNNMAQSSICRS